MTSDLSVEYQGQPSFLPVYAGLFLRRRPGLKAGETLPHLVAVWPDARVDAERLKRYREACALPDDGCLPLLYPHILCSVMHLGIMAHRRFPLSPMGAVHVRNHVLQHRRIGVEETLDVRCRLYASRPAKKGLELDITTVVSASNTRVWESVSTYLLRGRFGEPVAAPNQTDVPDLPEDAETARWKVPANMGRRYAGITGDYNPIHVSNLSARFFGFKRAIIHGMWTAARAMADMPPLTKENALRADVLFKGPVFIGSEVTMRRASTDTDQRFDLYCADDPRPCLQGWKRVAEADTTLAP